MKRSTFSFGMVLCGCISAGAALTGCSDDKTTTTGTAGTGGTGGAGSGGTGGTAGTAGAGGTSGGECTSQLQILFPQAYSAFDGQNTYKVPAIAIGATATDTVKWTASDPSMVDLDPDTVQFGDAGSVPGRGVMITTRKAGKVTITAAVGSACGSSELTITQATPQERQIGSDRYNNGVPITFDGGRTPACSNCHGATSPTMFLDVQHTPQQTGGYSDQEMIDIFTKGQKPPGGGCRVVSCGVWTSFHQWITTEEETKGIVFYLRSLEPAPQGAIDFGGTQPPPPRDSGVVPRN
jgi:hypothetical protein